MGKDDSMREALVSARVMGCFVLFLFFVCFFCSAHKLARFFTFLNQAHSRQSEQTDQYAPTLTMVIF